MKKGTKLFLGIILASMMLGTTVLASTQGFEFYLVPERRVSTGNYPKADAEQRAYVSTTYGDLNSGDKVWFRVRYANENFATVTKSTNIYTRMTLSYLKWVPAGGAYHLNGQQDTACKQVCTVGGNWTP
ncbi:MAG: hypothetical protein H7Y18_04030 [Clostridiaceae bacterium]|nr:hypothetical protein [Clostridiaceae bacterium]